MSPADGKYGNLGLADELMKIAEMPRVVIIEVGECAAHHDRVRLESFRGCFDLGKVDRERFWVLYEPNYILGNVIAG